MLNATRSATVDLVRCSNGGSECYTRLTLEKHRMTATSLRHTNFAVTSEPSVHLLNFEVAASIAIVSKLDVHEKYATPLYRASSFQEIAVFEFSCLIFNFT